MKKLLLLMLVAFATSTNLHAQYWQMPNPNANANPGGLNADPEYPVGGGIAAGWTTIQAMSATPVWSVVQTLPFTFSFNGSAVTQFKVSTSGILTFDIAASSCPSYTKATLPDATIPNQSVCIWGLAALGANDNIVTKTFGTAPNRQLWIQFSSYGYGSVLSDGSNFCYWSIVLEETTNKIHIVDNRTGGYATTKQVSAGIQINSTSAYMVATSPNLNALATTDPTAADNSYYTFIPGTQPANDAAATATSSTGYNVTGSNIPVSLTVKNLGSAVINSYTIKYQEGANPAVSQSVTGLNLASFASNSTTFTTQYNVASLGAHPLKVWVELPSDANHANDTLGATFTGVAFMPARSVVMEEPTGTWCGWCVRGIVYMDSIYKAHPNDVVPISVHNADPMTVTTYDAGVGTLISGYPSLLVDRKEVADPSDAFTMYSKYIGDFGYATVNINSATVAGSTMSVNSSIIPAANLTGDYRLALVITEDRVNNASGGTWDQHNYYAVGGSGNSTPMANSEYNFNTLPGTIPSATMYYDFVARDIVGGFDGAAGSLPSTMNAGTTYSHPFTWTIPAGDNVFKMRVAVLLIDKNGSKSKILNAKMTPVFPAGVSTIAKNNTIEILAYPNPVKDNLYIDLTLEESSNASCIVTDMMGHVVMNKSLGLLHSGIQTTELNTSNFTVGLYNITIVTNKGSFTNSFIKK